MPRTARITSGTNPEPSTRTRLNEEPAGELEFGVENQSGRIGDPRGKNKTRAEFPPSRIREAGRTGGEIDGGPRNEHDVTADDMSPETLLDENRSRSPSARAGRQPTDTGLRTVGAADIGPGGGLDEQELADTEPVGRHEAERLRRKAAEHARDPNFFEPNEAAAQAARNDAGNS